MKVGIAQINNRIGDHQGNTDKMIDTIDKLQDDVDLIVFPELTTIGYPGNDLYADDELIKAQLEQLDRIQEKINQCKNDITAVFGFIDYDETKKQPGGGMKKFNGAAVMNKHGMKKYHKQLLCDYDVFFESRHFTPGMEQTDFQITEDLKGTMTICEDIRDKDYDHKPMANMDLGDTDRVINLSSSPFHLGKLEKRMNLLKEKSLAHDVGMIYVNQVGGQDDMIFDGGSMVVDKDGNLLHQSPQFEEDITIIDTDLLTKDLTDKTLETSRDKYEQMHDAVLLGLKDYLNKTGIEDIVIGVSGGIDSSISLYLLSQILPPEKIHAVYMPSKHSTNSRDDAFALADKLGIKLREAPITSRFDNALEDYQQFHEKEAEGITYENIQARIRGEMLLEWSNSIPMSMIINNSNQTELLLGYGTMYGDLIGGYNAIGDINKKEIYELARHINTRVGQELIPDHIINKPASAELKDDQVDPFDYERVAASVERLGFGLPPVPGTLTDEEISEFKRRIKNTEFKRRQSMPIAKVKQRTMGRGRLYPIAR